MFWLQFTLVLNSLARVCLGLPADTWAGLPACASILQFSPDGKTLAANLALDGWPVVLFDLPSAQERGTLSVRLSRRLDGCGFFAFAADSKTIVSFCPGQPVRFWDIGEREVRAELSIEGANYGGTLTPDGKTLIILADAGVLFWDLEGNKEVDRIKVNGTAAALSLSVDGKRLAARGRQSLYVWDVATKKLIHDFEQSDTYLIQVMAFSPDGKRLASTGKHPLYVHFWDADTGKKIGTVDMHAWKEKDICHVKTIAFSPDSKTAAMGGDRWIFFVDVERATVFTQVPVKGVLSLAFSPDGKTIAAGCEDKTVKLFRAVKPKTDEEIYKK